MKYEFIKVDEDTSKLKYKDKEFIIKRNIKLVSEMQGLAMKARVKMIQDFAKEGQSIKDLTIEKKVNGKTYYDNSNKEELENIYQEQITLEYFNDKCKEIFDLDFAELIQDIGLETEDEGAKFSQEFIYCLAGITPTK